MGWKINRLLYRWNDGVRVENVGIGVRAVAVAGLRINIIKTGEIIITTKNLLSPGSKVEGQTVEGGILEMD